VRAHRHTILEDAISNGWTPNKLLCKLGNYVVNNREIGSHEAVDICLSIPTCRFTCEFVHITTGEPLFSLCVPNPIFLNLSAHRLSA